MTARLISAIGMILLATTFGFGFDLQGHRGARGLMPENTLPAFAKALSLGVSTLEFDTGVTKDGVVVVSHNPSLDADLTRGPDGAWVTSEQLIKSLKFQELQQFDVGRLKPKSRTASRFPKQIAVDGTRIPSLAQVFELVQGSGNTKVRFNIETKINPLKPDATLSPEQFVEALLAVVKKYQMEPRVSIQSFDWRSLQIVQRSAPEIETVYLSAQQNWMNTVDNGTTWTAGFNVKDHDGSVPRLTKAAGGKVWSPFYRDLSETKLKQAQALGLKVIPWTINDGETMANLIRLGVDGLITDYPDVLREVMKKEGLAVPTPTPVNP